MHFQTESENARFLQHEVRMRPIVKIRLRPKVTFRTPLPHFYPRVGTEYNMISRHQILEYCVKYLHNFKKCLGIQPRYQRQDTLVEFKNLVGGRTLFELYKRCAEH